MRIFLSYRAEDSGDFSDRVTDHLLRRYGPGTVVRNVVGRDVADYQQQLDVWLRQCQVVLVVIGPDWLDARDPHGNRLLDNPYDSIRMQIRAALGLNKLIVPLLANGATVPPVGTLPEDITALSMRQAYAVRGDPDFNADMFGVYGQINTQLEWHPASMTALISAGSAIAGFIGIIFAANVVGSAELELLFGLVLMAGFLIALATGVAISVQRRHWLWLAGFIVAFIAAVGAFAIPKAITQYEVWLTA